MNAKSESFRSVDSPHSISSMLLKSPPVSSLRQLRECLIPPRELFATRGAAEPRLKANRPCCILDSDQPEEVTAQNLRQNRRRFGNFETETRTARQMRKRRGEACSVLGFLQKNEM